MRLPAAALLFAASCAAQSDGKWTLQFFYDVDKASFEISDLKFASPMRGVAVGAIVGEKSVKPMSAITSDGGAHWNLVPLKEPGLSLFFVNDSLGWMVTSKGLWQTDEGGLSWRKRKAPEGILRVYFLDPDHGWAVGLRKQVFETTDGGSTWTGLAFPAEVSSNPQYSRFTFIEFANRETGMIGGVSTPPRRIPRRGPEFGNPESVQRAWPHLTLLADTRDGGKTWKPTSASLFGEITTARMSPEGWGLGLIQFSGVFDWPSEVVFLNWKAGSQKRAYREKDHKVTDLAIAGPRGPVYLAGAEQIGTLQTMVIPRKVKIAMSEDAVHFTQMAVDYRAVARRVVLASAGGENLWAATDTGMILKLTK